MRRLTPPTASAASSTFMVPRSETRMVSTGFLSTVSTPAMEAMCTTASQPCMAWRTAAASVTSPTTIFTFGWRSSPAGARALRRRVSKTTTSLLPASRAGFRVVQLLPVGAVCGGETSPYAAASAFAIDPVYLGLDACEDFRLAGGREALAAADGALLEELGRAPRVRWGEVGPLKTRAAAHAFARFQRDEWKAGSARAQELTRFCEERRDWLPDYALFSVLHDRFARSWLDWEPALRDRVPEALAAAREEHREQILFRSWLQWQLDGQWRQARAEAAERGVELMGDLPFVVARDSADVWCRRDIFHPELRVGTPPDAFSPEGPGLGPPPFDWGAVWRTARARV